MRWEKLWAFILWGLALLCCRMLVGCGGDSFTPLFDPSLGTSPTSDGGPSEGSPAGSDGAHDPGLDRAQAGEFRGDGAELPPVDGPPDSAASDAPYPRDVLADPWPEDVVVERMPAPNCFIDPQGQSACCFPRNQPPVDCELQNMPHFCSSCPR